MDNAVLGALVFFAIWGFNILIREIRNKTVGVNFALNVESVEAGDYDLPVISAHLQKNLLLATVPSPGMQFSDLGLQHSVKVTNVVVSEDGIMVNGTLKVPQSEFESHISSLKENRWSVIQ